MQITNSACISTSVGVDAFVTPAFTRSAMAYLLKSTKISS
jgi:hypothetical protein